MEDGDLLIQTGEEASIDLYVRECDQWLVVWLSGPNGRLVGGMTDAQFTRNVVKSPNAVNTFGTKETAKATFERHLAAIVGKPLHRVAMSDAQKLMELV